MKPILFNTEMVQATYAGRKTVTRRFIRNQPSSGVRKSVFVRSGYEDGHGKEIKCPYVSEDKILYVRETFLHDPIDGYYYKASAENYEDYDKSECRWKPSIHMPGIAARLFLTVKSIKIQKLEEMTGDDCLKEGIEMPRVIRSCDAAQQSFYLLECFKYLWNEINEKRGYGWYLNPWVFVVEFERRKID